MVTKKAKEIVEIRPVQLQEVVLRIVGDTPLITHAWSAKAKRQILEKEIGATKVKARELKNPLEDFCSSMYWLTPMPDVFTQDAVQNALDNGARFGFPVTAIKQAAISAAYRMGWSKDKVSLQGAFFIVPDVHGYYAGDLEVDYDKKKVEIVPNVYKAADLVEIYSDAPIMREDAVKVQGSADMRYRGEFQNWYINLKLRYNVNGVYSLEQIVNMINAGGFGCGIGEWRIEKDGASGAFHVEAV